MNAIWALQEAAEHGAEQPGIFNINLGLSFWTVAIFLALLALLYRYAYPHILAAVEERERRIEEAIRSAEETRAEAERLLEEQRRELARAHEKAQRLVAEGRQGAEKVREDLVARAKKEQEEMLARARDDIRQERDRAVEQLRREAVDLSLAAAEKLVGRRMDAEEDRRLVRAFLAEAGDGSGGS